MKKEVKIFWFRRDLRLDDNVGFFEALKSGPSVLSIFIFDTEILDKLPKDDPRVSFIYLNLQKIQKILKEKGSSLGMYYGKPLEIFKNLLEDFTVTSVYTNTDYEPYARQRDKEIEHFLSSKNVSFHSFKDQVIFQFNEILKKNGEPYVVYTAYMNLWKEEFRKMELEENKTENYFQNLYHNKNLPELTLSEIGFKLSKTKVPPFNISSERIRNYEKYRDYPAKDATTHLGPYLRFGIVSIRNIVKIAAEEKNETFLQELIWREFFMQILYHYPQTVTEAFKIKYDRIKWRNNEEEFELWKAGKTGYPLVDAGMRQMNSTGFMHNRIRMLVGSFLCKHLLIDWRWGEAYFAEKLLDYELSSNVGNWQWVAGSGIDAAPYFRIFNPTTQILKFDKDLEYVKSYVGEFGTNNYPPEIVDHKEARERALREYKEALSN